MIGAKWQGRCGVPGCDNRVGNDGDACEVCYLRACEPKSRDRTKETVELWALDFERRAKSWWIRARQCGDPSERHYFDGYARGLSDAARALRRSAEP